jgi:hypothetical protein
MFGRLAEFFEDDGGRLSMTRLLSFLAFFPASYVVCAVSDQDNKVAAMSILLTAYVIQTGINKMGEVKLAPKTTQVVNNVSSDN